MKRKVIILQKGQNVIKTYISLLVFLMFYISIYSQTLLNNKYTYCYGSVDNGECKTYTLKKNGIFLIETDGELGRIDYSKGHYFIKNDSLILNYDLTELKVNDFHKYKYYENNKDSIKVSINIFDLEKKPIKGNSVAIYSEKIVKYSNKDGFLEFNLKKEKKQLEFNVASRGFGYDFSIWKNKNYEIDVYLNLDNYGKAIKNQIVKYKILEQTDDFIKLKNYNGVMKLIKQSE